MSNYIEKKQRFSQSSIWTAQREYYDREGIDAWTSDVPFYVTSNPFIANSYANVAIRFIQDWTRQHPDSIADPFYFIELGTGPGQFSYYLLKRLLELQQKLGLDAVTIRYVMSDFTEKNIDFWSEHEKLQPYIEQGVLDFAQLDLENAAEIVLRHSGETLTSGSTNNPLIVIGNYIFDTLRTDIFTVKNGQLCESLVSLVTDDNNYQDGEPKDWEKVEVEHEAVAIQGAYYGNPHFDEILATYWEHLTNTHFLFPIATLNALNKLKAISHGKMLVLSSDKAYSTIEEQDELDYPELAFHGSFSVMANFDAIARAFKSSGGDALLQTPREGITSGVFSSGFSFKDLPETKTALDDYIEGFSPGDYFLLHDQICNEDKNVDIEVYAALLCMSHWDPYVYDLVNERIISLIPDADHDTLEYLAKNMHKVSENFYFVSGSTDVLFNIALFFHETGKYHEATPYYKESIHIFGEQHVALYNLAICYYEIDEIALAIELLERSLEIDPKQKDAKDWLKSIKKKLK
jgi:tetratricopeptide (TPR) repeat protein